MAWRRVVFVVAGLAAGAGGLAGVVLATRSAPHSGAATPASSPSPPTRPSPAASPPVADTPSSTTPAPTATPPTAAPTVSPVVRPRAAPPSPVDNAASRLRTLPAGTRQVIVVSAAGYTATTATVETFQRGAAGWQPALRTMTGRIGEHGFTDRKVEGDLATPTGVYPIGATMYGIAADPGVRYRYHRLAEGDYWNGNGGSPGYNSFVHGDDPGGGSEALWRIAPQYTHFAVIDYNVPAVPASPPRGSGIFLHQIHPGHATAGCVAVAAADLVAVLRWLDPAAAPRIVMAPRQVLDRY